MSEAAFGIRINWFGKDAETGSRRVIDSLREIGKEAQAGTYQMRDASGMLREVTVRASTDIANSAKQQAFALRQVPMQFTDIVTSLVAGQPPMMVLLQQGGQLKDTFGGIAPAARALGGYVMGLVNPLTVSAAAAVGLGVAIAQGAVESDRMRRAVIMSGDALGITYSDMTAAAGQAATATGQTRAAAAAVVTTLASSGRVAVGELARVTDAALRLDSVGAQSIEDSVKQFAELGKSPVEASIKLNEQFHYLTESTYRQIKALQDMGREDDAAALAQRTYAEAMSQRAVKIEQDLGNIERAWKNAGLAAKGAWDWFLNIGREDSLIDKLTAAHETLANLKRAGTSANDSGYKEAQLEVTVLQTAVDAQRQLAQEKETANRKNQAGIAWDQQSVQVAGNRHRREIEIAKARQLGLDAGKSELEIQQRIAEINKKYADPKAEKTDRAKSNDLITQYERENQLALEKLSRSADLALMSDRERAIAEAQYKAEDQANSMRERVISSLRSEAEEKRALLAIDQQLEGQKTKIAEYTAAAFDSSRTFEFGWNKAMQQFADDSSNSAKIAQTSVTNFVDSSATAMGNWAVGRKANFADVFTNLASYLVKIQLMAAGSSLLSGLFPVNAAKAPSTGGEVSFGGTGSATVAVANAHGNVFSVAPTLSQYSNSLLTSPTFFGFDKLHAFATGAALGVGGEAGTEAVMPLTRVGNDLGVRAMINVVGSGSGGTPKVTINNYNNSSGAQVETRQTTNANGDISIDTFITDIVNAGIANGSFNTAFKNKYNLRTAAR